MIAIHGKPVVKLVQVDPQPILGLGEDECPPVPWSGFAPLSNEEAAEWGL